MVYVTKEIVKSLAIPELKLDKTEVAASIDALCISASAMIDRFTDRPAGWFNQVADPAPAPTTRRFRGEGKNYLRIPRHVGTASIVSPIVAGSTVYENANGWIVYNDGIAGSGNGPDYYPESGQGGFFNCGSIYDVSAIWAFAVLPADIELAAAFIVGHIWDRGRGVIGQITPTGFVIERDMPPMAKTILEGWKRREGEIV
jgi:hypothetical protein